MELSRPLNSSPSFSTRERVAIALGVLAIVLGILAIAAGPPLMMYFFPATVAVLGILIFQQLRDLREAAKTLHDSEERFRLLIDDIVFIVDLENLQKLHINHEASRILGYSNEEFAAMGGGFFKRVLHPDDAENFASMRARLAALPPGRALEFECRMKHASGEWRSLSCRAVIFARSEDGSPKECLGIAQDVTALKRAQEDARQLEQAAAEKQRLALLGELCASVAHELRNPMQGMLNCVEELRAHVGGEGPNAATLDLLTEGLQRTDSISARLLNMARSHEVTKVPSNVAGCIDGTVAFVRARAQKSNIELVTRVEPDLPLVPMNPDRISEVVLNLLSNSLDACTPQGGRVTLTAGRSTDKKHLELRVSDTGSGIPPEAQGRIFDSFFSTKPPGKGTGLGMAIVKRIVEAHAGSIKLVETSSKGTTFLVSIPMDSPAEPKQID